MKVDRPNEPLERTADAVRFTFEMTSAFWFARALAQLSAFPPMSWLDSPLHSLRAMRALVRRR
jgi:hypothetical protein